MEERVRSCGNVSLLLQLVHLLVFVQPQSRINYHATVFLLQANIYIKMYMKHIPSPPITRSHLLSMPSSYRTTHTKHAIQKKNNSRCVGIVDQIMYWTAKKEKKMPAQECMTAMLRSPPTRTAKVRVSSSPQSPSVPTSPQM